MKEIRLYGVLGLRFGRVHRLAVSNAGEAVRALCANHPEFERAFMEAAKYYRVWVGKTRVRAADEILLPSSDSEVIRIAPVVAGAGKGGIGQAILGALIITTAVLLAPVTAGGSLNMGATAFSAFGMSVSYGSIALIGVSMALGGVSQMLASTPQNNASSAESVTNKPSYIFNGAVNTAAQGNPVPVGYGRLIVGSAVVSAGMAAEDIAI